MDAEGVPNEDSLKHNEFPEQARRDLCWPALSEGNCLITAHPMHLFETVLYGSSRAHSIIPVIERTLE
ncbi:MAG: hypothetical protein ACJAVZ_001659 [Afipia broomeae]|jgi:hypothetical protein